MCTGHKICILDINHGKMDIKRLYGTKNMCTGHHKIHVMDIKYVYWT